jgi:hypothetical protein
VREDAGTATFTVTLDRVPAGADVVTVDYSFGDVADNATLVSDYNAAAGTLTFDSGTGASLNIVVAIVDDAIVEPDETFTVKLSNASGNASISDTDATGTILNEDYLISSITDDTVREDDGTATFTVTLDRVPAGTDVVTVDYSFGDVADSAALVSDYNAAAGTLTFDSGTGASLDIVVAIVDDAIVEPDETFTVKLSNPTGNATISDTDATGTILNEDYLISSISDDTVREDAGTATFTVTLDRVPAGTDVVTVDYSFGDVADSAALVSDYNAAAGTLTFDSGSGASLDIVVNIVNDALLEPNETFTVKLSNASGNATISDTDATGTILNEDYLISSITDDTVREDAGTATFTVTLDRVPAGTDVVTVDYTFGDVADNATLVSDYNAAAGTLTFDSGTGASLDIVVAIVDDAIVEPDETFTVKLSNPTGNATISDTDATGTILNDDYLISSISDPTVREDVGMATFTVTLDQAPVGTDVVTVDYAFGDVADTAVLASDYNAVGGTLTFDSGTGASQDIVVAIVDDAIVEPDETFTVKLSNASGNASISDTDATGTILNDDYLISSITDDTVLEDAGTATFTVTLDRVPAVTDVVTVDYSFGDAADSAALGSDYNAAAGTLIFDSGTGASLDIVVAIVDDAIVESVETFTVKLSNPGLNATISDTDAIGTITDDDYEIISISDATVPEGIQAQFTVTLDRAVAAGDSLSIDYKTMPGSATPGSDYTAANSTLTINAGSDSGIIPIDTTHDTVIESDEDFTVELSNVGGAGDNAMLTATQATGTILNNDYEVVSISNPAVIEGNPASGSD